MININDWPSVDKDKLFDYLRYNSYRSERYKLFYIATPKVACTSLKWWFAALEGHSRVLRGITDSIETDPDLVIHDTFHKVAPNVTNLMPEELSEALTSDSYFRFAVARNPYKRIFSAWQSKLLLKEPVQTGPYLQCDFFHRPIECAEDITAAFEGFLEHLATNETPSYWDVHWTPQATLLRPDLINYSKLVKIENAKELSQALAEWLGGHIPNPFANRRTNESLIPYLPEFVTERSSELIRSLYAEDFETFGYDKHPPEAKETFSADQFDLAFKAITLIRGRNQRLGERNAQIASLNQSIVERDGQINAYRLQAEQFDDQLRATNAHISSLNLALTERENQIAGLRQAIEAHDEEIAALRHHLKEIMVSRSWRITKPLRALGNIARRLPPPSTFSISSDLAEDFDPDFYLRMYPDIAASGVNPKKHFRLFGRQEGRLGCAPRLDLVGDFDQFNPSYETILIVSHEASLTGAPVLSLNLVQELVSRYNVVAMLLGGGVIEEAFYDAGAVVVRASAAKGNPLMAELIIESLLEHGAIKFALVNSIESRSVLPALARQHIPAITLIHEFAAYTRPKEAFREAVFWSGEAVFSTGITLESALYELPDLNGKITLVLPQGRCLIPPVHEEPERLESDRSRILHAFRPQGKDENVLVVLGAGFVQLRKGVDLFIECAARVVHSEEGRRCRFVWIGSGFDPDLDINYSVYLQDQIKRAGLESSVFFLDETLAIELAYEQADMLLLSSRLDPLPNVAIDAMTHGLPVLCFDKTTGIADILTDEGLAQACVAEYLDTNDMARKIMAMANSDELREDVSNRSRALAFARFDMSSYVAALEKLAFEVGMRTQQEKEDFEAITCSGRLIFDFVSPPHWKGLPNDETTRRYVRGWQTGIGRRKPFPGFHPGVYREKHGLTEQKSDPFADYLRTGCPSGPWLQQVITPQQKPFKVLPDDLRVALHLHVFYPTLLNEMLKRIMQNSVRPHLFISVPNETARQAVLSELQNYPGRVISVLIVPNRGRDIGPFLTAFGEEIVENYDVVGHLHTKVSADAKDTSVGKTWYQFLLENLLGGKAGAMADTILASMFADPSIGLVFPDDPYVVGWEDNKQQAEALAEKLAIRDLTENINFPVGTMFWARITALRPLIELGWDWDDYPEEPLPYDGSLLHAVERILPFLVAKRNLRNVVTNISGITR